METIYIATKNKGKIEEFTTFFKQFNTNVKSLLDVNKDINIKETGKTFTINALIKAHTLCNILNIPVVADDSGLEVDYLNNEPGVYSARYAGSHGDDLKNNLKILDNLKNVPFDKRTARFVCALAFVYPTGKEIVVKGECFGYILDKMQGESGFGYDPIFYLPEKKKTFAQLTRREKNNLSHRGKALKELEKVLINDENYRGKR